MRERSPRAWTLKDSVLLLVADDLVGRGFPVAATLAFTAAVAPEVIPLTVDEERQAWLVAWSDPAAPCGWSSKIVNDSAAGIEVVLSRPDAVIFRVRDLVRDAMDVLLLVTRAEAAHHV